MAPITLRGRDKCGVPHQLEDALLVDVQPLLEVQLGPEPAIAPKWVVRFQRLDPSQHRLIALVDPL